MADCRRCQDPHGCLCRYQGPFPRPHRNQGHCPDRRQRPGLVGKLACRTQHDAPQPRSGRQPAALLRPVVQNPLQHGCQEGGGLPAARLRQRDHIPPRQHLWDDLRLHCARLRHALAGQCARQEPADSQCSELAWRGIHSFLGGSMVGWSVGWHTEVLMLGHTDQFDRSRRHSTDAVATRLAGARPARVAVYPMTSARTLTAMLAAICFGTGTCCRVWNAIKAELARGD